VERGGFDLAWPFTKKFGFSCPGFSPEVSVVLLVHFEVGFSDVLFFTSLTGLLLLVPFT
jgi:hypothetical protein